MTRGPQDEWRDDREVREVLVGPMSSAWTTRLSS
jgi:hypothetical protein